MKVLIVDDDPNILEMLPIILANEGVREIVSAGSAHEALIALRKASPAFDCMIFDLEMPRMNGIQLCRKVRAMENYKYVPIIMLTATRDEKSIRKALRSGAIDYITKPFDVLQIGVRIRMAAKLVKANRLLSAIRQDPEQGTQNSLGARSGLTQREVMNIFAEDLYKSRSG